MGLAKIKGQPSDALRLTTGSRQERPQVGAVLMSPDDDDAPLLVLLPSRREPSDNTALSPRMLKRPYADFRGLVQLGEFFDLALQPPGRLGTGGRLVIPGSETAGKVAEEGAHRVG